jgi:lipid II:glycine glycyltransferase (peptidoglycan interpeptide bridge formation enzyme)
VNLEPKRTSATDDELRWNARLEALGGHLLQSWQWGSFKERYGWSVDRVAYPPIGEPRAVAQILYRSRGPVSIGYIPRGPAFFEGDDEAIIGLLNEIDRSASHHRALFLVIEPNSALPLSGTFRDHGFVKGPHPIQPERTVQVPLLEDEALLKQMHEKTRYSVRLAKRRDVEIEIPEDRERGVTEFFGLLSDTSSRNEFAIRPIGYYADFLTEFGEHAQLLLARHEGNLAAGVIAARFGAEAMYMYGASSTENRGHGATFLLQYEAMRWGRTNGSTRYDLWGIPAEDPEKTGEGGRAEGTKGDHWSGLYRFKTGFGGEIVRFPVPIERRYHPFLSAAARRVIGQHE